MNDEASEWENGRRLDALRKYSVLDTPPEVALDEITRLIAQICEVPMALISLLDVDRQWFKSRVGLEVTETGLELSFCKYARRQSELFVVPDARLDARFSANPQVTGEPGIRFYAGAPLIAPSGVILGTLCVLDTQPRTLRPEQVQALWVLSRQVVTHFEMRRQLLDLQKSEKERANILASSHDGIIISDAGGRILEFNAAAERIFGRSAGDVLGLTMEETIVPPELRAAHRAGMQSYLETGTAWILGKRLEMPALRADGSVFTIELTVVRSPGAGAPKFIAFLRDISTHKQAETALRASEEQFANAFKYAPIGKALVSPEGRFLKINRALCQILGREEADLLALTFQDITHPEDLASDLNNVRQLLAGEIPFYQMEKRYIHRRGHLVWSLLSVSLVRNEAGEPVHFISQIQDFTERKQTEEALRDLADRHTTTLESLTEGFFTVDRDWVFTYVNRAAEEIFLHSRAELLGRVAWEVFPEMQGTVFKSEYERAMAENVAVHVEGNYANRRWFEARAYPSARGLAIYLRDVSEPHQVREALQESEERFRRLLQDVAAVAVQSYAPDGTTKYWNTASEQLYGYTAGEAIGRNLLDLIIPPEMQEGVRQAIAEMQQTGVAIPAAELTLMRKDGSRVTVFSSHAIVNIPGSEAEFFCIDIDLTERKKLEQQILRAQRMESIGTLAGGIAHDLNNVLAPIMLSIEVLKMKFPDAASLSLLNAIYSSAERGADMVRQVLSFARGVEGRRLEIQIKPLIQAIERIVIDTFPKNIDVCTIIPPDLWMVVGDPTQLHQVLLNLCVNARDAMPYGGTLTLSAGNFPLDDLYASSNPDAHDGPHIFLEVEDTGTGMPKTVIEKIFDPFFTTKEIGKGTGLGLSTSLAIVKSHRGFIRVSSEPEKGTKFKVYLPANTEKPANLGLGEPTELPRGNGELILVVEDEAPVRQITQKMLETFGYQVVVACDGAEGVATYAARRHEIALVLTDMMMPVMDGPATIRVLRRINPAVRIIGASGVSPGAPTTQASALDIEYFLPKPYTASALLKTIRQVLLAPGEAAKN